MNLAIVGSRTFEDLEQVRAYVAGLPAGTVVISGGAEGVDQTAVEAAKARGLPTREILPNVKIYGPRRAPRERNRAIVAACDELVAFWGNEPISPGTSNVVFLAAQAGKLRGVIRPGGKP